MKNKRQIRIWLVSGMVLVALMVFIGGITRLTNSGLSMVTWEPVSGIVPPLSQEAWQVEFDQYKMFPEYKTINKNMTLPEFKRIFFWEYLHRLVGRIVGIVFIVPFVIFFRKKMFSPGLLKRSIVIFVLGGLQGFIGWYMVKSGLVENPDVSHYRLALHLVTAFILISYIYFTYLWVGDDQPQLKSGNKLMPLAYGLTGLTLFQIVYGAFTAGLDAAYGYNTFPLMGGKIIPDGYDLLTPFMKNMVENRFMVQFIHRTIGWLLLVSGAVWYFISKRSFDIPGFRMGTNAFLVLLGIQFTLGVLTLLLTGNAIPLGYALLHQITAMLLLLSAVHIIYVLRKSG